MLTSLEKTLIKSVYLKEYSHQGVGGEIMIKAVAANYEAIAQQILNFKKSEDMSDIKIDGISRDEDGRINFSLELKISNKTQSL